MPFPSGQAKKTLVELTQLIQSQVIGLKTYAVGMKAAISNPVSINQVLDFIDALQRTKDALNQGINTPGLADYAKAQFYNPTVDLVEEAETLIGCIDILKTVAVRAIPVDSNNYVKKDVLEADGTITTVSLQPASLTSLASALDQFIPAID